MRMRLETLNRDMGMLQGAHDGLILQSLRKAEQSSSPSSNTHQEEMTSSRAATLPDEKNSRASALYGTAPKNDNLNE
jgi:hypothetical protein